MIEFLLIILVAGVLVLAVVTTHSGGKGRGSKKGGRTGRVDREFVARKWSDIEAMSASGGGALRSAVSEADKLVDYVLKNSGVRGETMGERLKNSRGHFSDINAIWDAHKLRNAIAHEADFDVVPSHAREAIATFRQGLKDLGAL